MEPVKDKVRVIIPLAKCHVTSVERTSWATKFTIQLPGSVTITADVHVPLDLHLTDILTIYTEAYRDANTEQTPIEGIH
jgi:hypothetical protein